MKILTGFLVVALLINCVLLVTIVLMQRSKSDGLAGGAAFGSSFTEAFFGAGTPTVLVKITTWLGGIFFALSLALAVLFSTQHKPKGGQIEKLLEKTPEKKAAAAASNAVDRVTKEAAVSTNATRSTNAPSR